MLFPLGRIVATRGALRMLGAEGISPERLLHRHSQGDWGELGAEDAQANADALAVRGRLFSAYDIGPSKRIWVITEADRSLTTVLLPDEY